MLNDEVDVAITAKPEQLSAKLTYIELDHIPMSVIAPTIAPLAIQQLLNQGPNWQALPFILAESGPARSRANTWFKEKKYRHQFTLKFLAMKPSLVWLP